MGIVTPLQLIAANGLLNNQGLKPLPAALVSAINQYNATSLMQNFFVAVDFYKSRSFFTESTFDQLMSIGSTVCPALGNSIPVPPVGSYPNLIAEYLTINTVTDDSTIDPSGFTNLIEQTGSAYLGDGDIGRFAQGFLGVQGYINIVNSFINSVENSQTYLGPTFTDMANLTTNNISLVTTDMPKFAVDLRNTGKLINTKNLELFGTPAGLLQQLANVAGTTGSSLPGVIDQLKNINSTNSRQALTDAEIRTLINDNRVSLFNSTGVSTQEFDQLQKIAYQAMANVTGQELADVLSVLEVSTPNIGAMTDLLDLKKIFPNSYQTLQMPTASGPMPIYLSDGAVDQTLAPVINQALPTPSGCDELGKIIPPDQAVANKAMQSALQQITNISQTDAPTLATAIADLPRTPWTNTVPYLADSVVALANPSPSGQAQLSPDTVYYRAQQDVPVGTNITDTNYWQTYTPEGLSTMAELPLIESLTAAVPPAVAASFEFQHATGTGPNGNITVCDVIGTAIDHWNFATRLNTATSAINSLNPVAGTFVIGQTYTITSAGTTDFTLIGAANNLVGTVFVATGPGTGTGTATQNADIVSLNDAYIAIASAGDNATVLTQISNANTAISNLSANSNVATLNTAWNYMANYLNREKGYQIQAGIDYFQLLAGEKVSVYALTQSLSQFGLQNQACGPNQFLQNVVDQTILTGQAVVGALREAENQALLAAANLAVNITPDAEPEVTPPNAVTPVN
jgi:hypothetical protein